jgi:CBS domain-containing protein
MLAAWIRSIPIVDDGELVGIATHRDVLRLVARCEVTLEDAQLARPAAPAPMGTPASVVHDGAGSSLTVGRSRRRLLRSSVRFFPSR